MSSRIFHGETTHCRHQPRRHAFRYRMFWLAIDLEDLPELDRTVGGFGHNRLALVRMNDRDYGGPADGTIRAKVESKLRGSGVSEPIDRIVLITIPRIAGYVFNPVSFYLCHAGDSIVALLAEVRNTFGEMHHYVVEPERPAGPGATALLFRIPKQFYVSPFLDVNGEYELKLEEIGSRFGLSITLRQEEGLVFSAAMHGEGRPLTTGRLLATLCRLPLFAATIMVRIQFQACLLYVRRRLPTYEKPIPSHPATISAAHRSGWHRFRAAVVRRARKAQSRVSAEPEVLSPQGES